MHISKRDRPYRIPEYNLTGDLLAYLTCGLQYRYQNRGSLPPSTPVQLWFGEFIHGVMEEAYLEWDQDPSRRRFPWSWDPEIREIEIRINERLKARGLNSPPWNFCEHDSSHTQQGLCPDANHPHKLIASQRTETAINTWGQHLFPLIQEAEVRLEGIRNMPNYQQGVSRCNYYGITGVIDVISSVNLQNAPSGNLILHYLHQNPQLQQVIDNLSSAEYEIIIDYKGMRRPPTNDPNWQHHEWQVLTYAWLRSQQPQSNPIVAGIIFYLNELALSREDMELLKQDVSNNQTDVMPQGLNLTAIQNWRRRTDPPPLSLPFREQRSVKIMPVTDSLLDYSLDRFDNVVSDIETCVLSETRRGTIVHSWNPNAVERNCTACDFKTFCPNPHPRATRSPTVP